MLRGWCLFQNSSYKSYCKSLSFQQVHRKHKLENGDKWNIESLVGTVRASGGQSTQTSEEYNGIACISHSSQSFPIWMCNSGTGRSRLTAHVHGSNLGHLEYHISTRVATQPEAASHP